MALHYAICLAFESLCFIGQDLASAQDLQYAKGATSLLPAHNDISTFNIEVDGFYGDRVMSRSAYHKQLLRCEHIALELKSKAPHVKLFNATEGGAFINGFDHVSLLEFASAQNLANSDHGKSLIWENRAQIELTHVTDYLTKITTTMDQIIAIANAIIELDISPEKRANENTSIAELMKKFLFLNGATLFYKSRCKKKFHL